MNRRIPLLAALVSAVSLVSAVPAAAQDSGRFEFGMFGGVAIGSRISLTPGSDIRIGDAGAFGLRGAYDFSRHFGLEASWSHARPTATTRNPSTGAVLGETSVDVDTYTLSALYNYGHGRVRGYFGLGAGVMSFDPVLAASTGSSARFTTSLSAGGKLFVTPRVALRLDGTYRLRTTDSRVSTVVCLDGCKTYTTSYYSGAELTAGVSVRLGDEPFGDALSPAGPTESQRRFWAAAGSVAFFDLVPWAFNRYVTKAEFAYISMDTFRANVTAGFGYDRDSFKTDQSSHPFHGSLFFNSARSNGYGFWESGIFAAAGSFAWELALEKEPPAINDLVNTTLGGMSRGEAFHRLATMLRDNTATGASHFWRELGAGVMDPAGFLTRLTRGELKGTTRIRTTGCRERSASTATSGTATSAATPRTRTRRSSASRSCTGIRSSSRRRSPSTRSFSGWTSPSPRRRSSHASTSGAS